MQAVSHLLNICTYPSSPPRPPLRRSGVPGKKGLFVQDLILDTQADIQDLYVFSEEEVQEALDLKMLYSVDYSPRSGLYTAMMVDSSGPADETSFASL